MDGLENLIDKEAVVEVTEGKEFYFDHYSLVRVNNHWEIQFEDSQGAQSIIVQPQDFDEEGVFKFLIDDIEEAFLEKDFFNIEKFCVENNLI